MPRTEKYFIGPQLLGDIRRVVGRVDGEPYRVNGASQEVRLQDMAGRGGAGGGIRIGTFTGAWAKGEYKEVTVVGGTTTASVLNVSLPLEMDDQSPNTATRSVLYSRVNGDFHAVEIEQGGICGKWKEYLVKISVSGCGASGAQAVVREVNIGGDPEPPSDSGSGPVSVVDVLSGGSGYARRGREQPVVGISAASTNVSFSVSYQQLEDECGLPYWRIGGVTASGPTAFLTPQTLSVAPANSATQVVPAVLSLSTAGVSIVEPGAYYKESNSLTPYLPTLTVNVTQQSPSSGSGAVFTPVVDSTPTSPSFGRVTGITITDPGDEYVAWKWNGSIPFAGADISSLPGFKAYETQVLGHQDSCLQWFSVTACATESE